MKQLRFLLGISVFWLALSMLFDGLNTLVLPHRLLGFTDEAKQATQLGLATFVGLLLGTLAQPVAGTLSDRLYPRWGRSRMIGLGVVLILAALAWFGVSRSLPALLSGYVAIQVAASISQAAQQGFIPDLVPVERRGMAAGLKGFMDIGGAMLGFVVLGQLLGAGQAGAALLAIGAVLVLTFLLTLALVREPWLDAAPPALASEVEAAAPTTVPHSELRDLAWTHAFRLDLQQHRRFVWLVVARFLFLLGTYAVGRFLLYFVADRLRLPADRAAEQAGSLLAGLALLTVIAALPAGWAADRWGRTPLMLIGAALSAAGALLLTAASGSLTMFLFGGLMSLGTAAFAGANWALTADLAPRAEAARFLGLANFGTAGAAAAAGLFGPLVDWADARSPGDGYTLLFILAGLAFVASAAALTGSRAQAGATLG